MPTRFRKGQSLLAADLNAALDEASRAHARDAKLPAPLLPPFVEYLRWGYIRSTEKPLGPAKASEIGGYECEVIGYEGLTGELVPLDRPTEGDELALYARPAGSLVILAALPDDGEEGERVELVFAFEKPAGIVCEAGGGGESVDSGPSTAELADRVEALTALVHKIAQKESVQ